MKHTRLTLPFLIQEYFVRYLKDERGLSPRSIEGYRDGIKLFLQFLSKEMKKTPAEITFDDLQAESVLKFLDYLEKERKNEVRSRNHRLAIIKSLVKYLSFRNPEFIGNAERLLFVPRKRHDKPMFEYLTRDEMNAVLMACDQSTESGRRDYMLFTLMYNSGMRVSEALSLKPTDIVLGKRTSVKINGKGRKKREVPLWNSTSKLLQKWLVQVPTDGSIFCNRHGEPLTRSGVESRLELLVKAAMDACPSLARKNVSPHTLRHTTAMHLLQAGVDITLIALWLGHSDIKTTHMYVEACVEMKAKALESVQDPEYRGKRFNASDSLLTYLEAL